MAIYDRPHDRPGTAGIHPRRSQGGNILMSLLLVAVVVAVMIAMLFQPNETPRIGDTNNAGPSVKTVTPTPSPSTSPTVPTPTPTTEPRPTQAPIQ